MSDGPFSAIVSDIDGTLLSRVNGNISPRLKAAVAEVTRRGISILDFDGAYASICLACSRGNRCQRDDDVLPRRHGDRCRDQYGA